jgi:ADP-ribosyl-[dinitrogen reductase] hydrolase
MRRTRSYRRQLDVAIEAARVAGDLLRRELYRPGGPRGTRHHAVADTEAEELIRERLLAAFPAYAYLGEETGSGGKLGSDHVWVVDPNDGTSSYTQGIRSSAVSIALLRDGQPILGVVYAFAGPDDEGDLVSHAQGSGPIMRNGRPVDHRLDEDDLASGSVVLLSQAADSNSEANARCVAPARFVAMPSIAYRLALAAVESGVLAGISLNGPVSWDVAAGHALVLAAGGILVDAQGEHVTYSRAGHGSVGGRCFGGAPKAVEKLVSRPWQDVMRPAQRSGPLLLHRALVADVERLRRAHGALLGGLASEHLGSLIEFRSAASIARQHPDGIREPADGGTWDTIAGQPTDDGELALALVRSIVSAGKYDPGAALDAYVDWYRSAPFDIGMTTAAALGAAAPGRTRSARLKRAGAGANTASQANGALMRASGLGLLGWRDAASAADWAREDAGLTHPSVVCREANAAYIAGVATAIGQLSSARTCYEAALAEARRGGCQPVIDALVAAEDGAPELDGANQGWVLLALRNAFAQLLHASGFEAGVVDTVRRGGDADTNAIVAGALLGAVHGVEAVPQRWRTAVLTCRPLACVGARRPRPQQYWPVDVLALAEQLLALAPP